MRIKILILSVIFFSLISSCSKETQGCVQNPVSAEKTAMVAFCTTNNITFTEHSSGILYQIITPGTGIRATLDSRIFVYYTGTLLNGTQFDALADPTRSGWQLKGLVEGWQIAIPLIQKGGRIKLVIPSSLAYGCIGQGSIPGNSPLYFDLTLTDIQ